MTQANVARGRFGEELVARWYRQRGYTVAARNWRCPIGELDLVVVRGSLVVFCEVKSRRTDGYGGPAAAVGPDKQRRLRRLASAWLADQRRTAGDHAANGPMERMVEWEVRFDVACVVGARVDVIESAF